MGSRAKFIRNLTTCSAQFQGLPVSNMFIKRKNLEEECLSDTMVKEQCQQQLLFESSGIGATVCPWEKKEVISLMLIEEGSGKEVGK